MFVCLSHARVRGLEPSFFLSMTLYTSDHTSHTFSQNQSNVLPCASNIITLSLATSVPLLQLCTPELVLSDIKGFATLDTNEMEVIDCSASAPRLLPINGTKSTWNQTTGTLTVPFALDTAAYQVRSFVFPNHSFDLS